MAAHDDLHQFVRDALARGEGRTEVEAVLVRAGWGAGRARAAVAEFADIAFPVPVPRPRPYLDARDAFLYLVLFGTLYASLFNLGVLLFEFISRGFPDPAFQDTGVYGDGSLAALRAAIAALIVAAPVFLFVSNRVALAIQRDPARRGSKVRRWLSYLTLTVASCVLIGDFIAVVTGLLSGELSTRFLLKAATVAAIAGGVFLYYQWDLKTDEQGGGVMTPSVRRAIGAIFMAIAAAAVIGGFQLAGSPTEARLQRLDERRVGDLRQLANAVELYRTRTGELPSSLDDVRLTGAWQTPPRDPETGAAYEYRILQPLRYELCATFHRASASQDARATDTFRAHTAGRQCFAIELKAP